MTIVLNGARALYVTLSGVVSGFVEAATLNFSDADNSMYLALL